MQYNKILQMILINLSTAQGEIIKLTYFSIDLKVKGVYKYTAVLRKVPSDTQYCWSMTQEHCA